MTRPFSRALAAVRAAFNAREQAGEAHDDDLQLLRQRAAALRGLAASFRRRAKAPADFMDQCNRSLLRQMAADAEAVATDTEAGRCGRLSRQAAGSYSTAPRGIAQRIARQRSAS